jgi:plastocyanin
VEQNSKYVDENMRRGTIYLLVATFLVLFIAPATSHAADTGEAPPWEPAPPSSEVDYGEPEEKCPDVDPSASMEQEVLGVQIEEDPHCNPDDPETVAAVSKGTNNVPMETLRETGLSRDAVRKGKDLDGDGDPDVINITLEVAELNGVPPSTGSVAAEHDIAPGIAPGFWVFTPKTRGMATENSAASDIVRAPSPAIRIEEGDRVNVKLENTHYMPHTIHFHGVDHPYEDSEGNGNDGVPQTNEKPVMPGESRTYQMTPEQAGTMFYHCHVQPSTHVLMGLNGMFVVEEERDNNTVQTFNIGNGKVRNPSEAVEEDYDQEYDMMYQGVDPELHNMINRSNDPRVLSQLMNREYDVTERNPDYYLLNGKSFPYTVRESMIVAEENQNIKARMINTGSESVSLHTHGHKPTATHYDGVKISEQAEIQRDVFDVSAAQRVDLEINTSDDGLNSYGPGAWFLHNHKEEAVTTDGIAPGGDVSLLTYKEYLGESGMPQTSGVSWDNYFTEGYYSNDVPVWASYDEGGIFHDVSLKDSDLSLVLPLGLAGMIFGAMIYLRFIAETEVNQDEE